MYWLAVATLNSPEELWDSEWVLEATTYCTAPAGLPPSYNSAVLSRENICVVLNFPGRVKPKKL